MEENRQNNMENTEELAQTAPLSRKDKLIIALVAICVIAVGLGVFFGVRFGIFSKNVKAAVALVQDTAKQGNATFSAIVKYDTHVTELDGTLHHTKDRSRVSCDINYGNRFVSIHADTVEDDAYFYIESQTDSNSVRLDISGLRYFLGESDKAVDWKAVLESVSSESLDLTDFYDPEKIDPAIESVKKKLTSPAALSSVISCSGKNGTYTIETDVYKFFVFVAKSMRSTFISDKSYTNLMDVINEEKKELKSQKVTVKLFGEKSYLDSVEIKFGGDEPISISIALSNIGTTSPQSYFEANPEVAEDVTLSAACRMILRSGLDTDGAYKEATMSLNAFAEFYSYDIVAGTVVIVYDEDGNDFRFIYTDENMLEEMDYEDENYSAWEDGGYVALDTTKLDSGKYKVYIYEPGESMRTSSSSDDYNNAYIAALHACYSITSARYEIPQGAIFLVKENGSDFQFGYEDGNLYDIYEQYYYVIYTSYSIADLSGIDDLPENVTLYLPSEASAEK